MPKLTFQSQGYWDRLQRAESWINRATNIQAWDDFHGPFIFYWIALNALYGRHLDSQRWEEEDLNWFLQRICEMDHEQGTIVEVVKANKRKSDRLLKDKFLLKSYWREDSSSIVNQILKDDFAEAQLAFDRGKIERYLSILFKRIRVLRNQIFHGCSTDRQSLNKNSLEPALEILEKLVPHFHNTFRDFGHDYDWGNPLPAKGLSATSKKIIGFSVFTLNLLTRPCDIPARVKLGVLHILVPIFVHGFLLTPCTQFFLLILLIFLLLAFPRTDF